MSRPESTVTVNGSGKDINLLKHTWKAQWITHPSASTLDYGIFLFRHVFTLKEKISEFIIFVSADNRYRLFVNGERVCYGPSIGDTAHQRYETLNIADQLNVGKNVIAAEVVNFGEYRSVSQVTYQTAFILQADRNLNLDINTGSADWKVIKNHAFSPVKITSEMMNAYYAAGPRDHVDDSKYPWGWNQLQFNDNHWLNPKSTTTEFAVGRGFLYGGAWHLVPRTIPFMEEKVERFPEIIRVNGIEKNDGFLNGKATIIPENSKVKILIDQKYHTTGYPELTYSHGKDSELKITYAEALIKDVNPDKKVSDGNLNLVDLKGNRNEFEGKSIFGYYDIICPDGGKNRFYKPLSRRTYRFVELEITTKEEALILEDYYGVYTGYPFEEKAKVETGDLVLSKIWDAAWRTLRNSADEMYYDSYYENLQYIGDTKIASLISIYVSGDDRLMRKAIQQFDDSRTSEGLTQSRYPSNIIQIIPPFSLIWVDMIYDYFMYRNDPEFLRPFIPGIKSVIDWFASRVDETGMLTNLKWWNFTDWTIDFPSGIPQGADDGYSANIALQFVKTLDHAQAVFRYFNLEHEVDSYQKLSKRIKKSVLEHCFDTKKGLIAETPDKKEFSQHTNILGILTDTFKQDVQSDIMKKVLEDETLFQATIYFKFYLFRALQKVGLGDLYFDLLGSWRGMIDDGMTTYGETDINPRSECHAWSSSPNFDFLHTVAGIYPGEHSFKSVVIEPNLGQLKTLNVEFPHPQGMITIRYSKNDNNINAEISMPEDLTGEFKWQGQSVSLVGGKQNIAL
ncbi:alpha-L-rhamnosidase N-terminal domain-containing protein [Winogradskyella sp. F6397]|uniref:Alpha-L-rhamnosidase N-terminal domain-containing protein n=1 Tax=Winogradskyella marina TaxID=2785530 RepID=A0ABS0EF99_9FLAO|nr:alpha-L-rhamnosidase N-terminal domain-containing protein [Winogradskyella marina]MBF8149102.1 alpha-L-rhamnosidase N-terminal domain-containing protein [Winogradskyella marina]